MERLQKVIANSGVCSRRKAEDLILAGKVKVDGKVVTELGLKVSEKSVVEVDGNLISKEEKEYYLLNKPRGVLTTTNDDKSRKTVIDLIDTDKRIYPVGRLDYDTTGVLLLTNDGDFANTIIHPRYHLKKVYEVTISGVLTTAQIKEMESGIKLEDGMTLPAKVWITNKNIEKNVCSFELTIYEGRNRQVKRMVEYFGYEVKKLNRKAIAFLEVNDLKPGEYRILKPFEVKQLTKLANEKGR